jgi:hypothetical protein
MVYAKISRQKNANTLTYCPLMNLVDVFQSAKGTQNYDCQCLPNIAKITVMLFGRCYVYKILYDFHLLPSSLAIS